MLFQNQQLQPAKDEGGFLRKLNPAKLFDAGASAIAGAARSGGGAVSDRITNLFRSNKDDNTSTSSVATHVEVVQAFALLRPTVVTCAGSTSVETASFNISLLDKRTNMPATNGGPLTRKWKECETLLSMITSLFPRLEGLPPVPPRPSGKTGAAAAAEIEDRRKYVQRCLEALCAHPGAAGTKDLQRFLKFGAEDGLGNLKGGHSASSARAMSPPQPPPASAASSSPAPNNNNNNSNNSGLTRASSSVNFQTGTRARSSSLFVANPVNDDSSDEPQHFDEQELIRDIFNLVDDDGSGYLDAEELEPFFDAIPKDILTEDQVQKCLVESDKEQTGVIDIRNFRALCQHLVLTSKRNLLDIVRPFRAATIRTLYECVATVCADSDPPPMAMEIDREECRVLLTILLNVGMRSVTPSEVAKQELALPVSLIEFDSLMDALLYSVSLSELIKALAGSTGGATAGKEEGAAQSKVLKLVNRMAARASPKVVKLLRERVAKAVPESACAAALQTALSRQQSAATASCMACDAMKKQVADLQQQLKDAKEEIAKSAAKALQEPASPTSPSMSPKVTDMIRAQLDETVQELEFSHHRIGEMNAQIQALMQENQRLRDAKKESDALDPEALGFAGNEAFLSANGGPYAAQTMYLLPTNMPSAGMGGDGWRRGVVDRAGALTYEGFALHDGGNDNKGSAFSASAAGSDNDDEGEGEDGEASSSHNPLYRPLGWTVDVYMVDSMGVEHMACRDKGGRRSIAWSLERGKLLCPWSRTVITQMPLGKWVRLTAQIRWPEKYVTWLVDGKMAVQRQPFRDAAAEEIATLDMYPRSSLVVCYANMRFFK